VPIRLLLPFWFSLLLLLRSVRLVLHFGFRLLLLRGLGLLLSFSFALWLLRRPRLLLLLRSPGLLLFFGPGRLFLSGGLSLLSFLALLCSARNSPSHHQKYNGYTNNSKRSQHFVSS